MKNVWFILLVFFIYSSLGGSVNAKYIVEVHSNGYVFKVDTLEELIHHRISKILPKNEIEQYKKIYTILSKIDSLKYASVKKQNLLNIIKDDMKKRVEKIQVNNQNEIRFVYNDGSKKQFVEMNVQTLKHEVLIEDISQLDGYDLISKTQDIDEYFSPKYDSVTLVGWNLGDTGAGKLYSLIKKGNTYFIESFSQDDMFIFSEGVIDTYTATQDLFITQNNKTRNQEIILCDFLNRDCERIYEFPKNKGLRSLGLGSVFISSDIYIYKNILTIDIYQHNPEITGTDSYLNEFYKTDFISLDLQ